MLSLSLPRFDAFTHKPTSQYSLAFEKASIIFNISAVLSCHAAHQNRFDETGLKTAYHSFQASAGMFTYINENFLHAPSIDLSRDTVRTLISIMLAQGQEVFLEKQVSDGKKPGLLAKLASQAGYLYSLAAEGVQENVNKGIFEKVWLMLIQVGVWTPTPVPHFIHRQYCQRDNMIRLRLTSVFREHVAITYYTWAFLWHKPAYNIRPTEAQTKSSADYVANICAG